MTVGCKNCGHDSHCGTPLRKTMQDGDNLPVEIEICKTCICTKCSLITNNNRRSQ